MTPVFEVELPLRWSDLDAQNHVNNVTYLDYLQEARVRLLRATGAHSLLTRGVVVTGHQVQYQRPITYSDAPIVVRLAVTSIGGARFEIGYNVSHDGEAALQARTTCCPFDFRTGAPRRLDDAERAALGAHREQMEPFPDLPGVPLRGRGHRAEITPRWSDQDVYAHINNVRFLDYFQEARLRLLLDAGHYAGADQPRIWLAARQDISYLGQADYRDEPYVIRTAVTRLGNSSVTMRAELLAEDTADARPLATYGGVMVTGDPVTGRPTPLTAEMRAGFGHFLAEG